MQGYPPESLKRQKMVTPAAKRKAVEQLASRRGLRRRRACGLVRLSRSVCAYRSTRSAPTELIAAIRRIAAERPRFG